MSFVATFNNPAYNHSGGGSGKSAAVPVRSFQKRGQFGEISILSVFIASDVASTYLDDTDDANNPVQLNSTVELKLGSDYWFRGYVFDRPAFVSFDEGKYLEITCFGTEGVLAGALCPVAGKHTWSISTEEVEVTGLSLKETSDYGNFVHPTLWPNPLDVTGAKCWLQDSDCNSDALDAAFNIGTLEAVLSTTFKGFQQRGFVKIDTEWIYYDGYDNAEADTKYRLRNCVRAQLGTTEANHSATTTVYNKLAKVMGVTPPVLYETSTKLKYGQDYTVNASLGYFLLNKTGGGTYTADVSYYDGDGTLGGSTAYTLGDLVAIYCKGDSAYGGAGFVDGDLDFDTLGIYISRHDHRPDENQPNAWGAIQDVLAALGVEDEVELFYNHSTGKIRLAIPAQGSADYTITGARKGEYNLSLQDVYNGVLVKYSLDQAANALSVGQAWHQAASGSGASPDLWRRTTAGGAGWENGTNTTSTAAGTFGLDMIFDGRCDTKLTAEFTHDPGGEFDFGHFWFGSGTTPPVVTLGKMKLSINTYRVIEDWSRTTKNSANTYLMRIDGCSDYNTSTHTGTWKPLGAVYIECTPDAYGGFVTVDFDPNQYAQKEVNALRIVFEYMAGPQDSGDYYTASVHDFYCEANTSAFALVQTSDNAGDKGDPLFLYAPETHEKMRGGIKSSSSDGSSRCMYYEIGASSPAAALGLARILLTTKLALYQERIYEYSGVLPQCPELGDVVAVDEDGDGSPEYTGVLRSFEIQMVEGAMVTTFRLLNYDAGVIE